MPLNSPTGPQTRIISPRLQVFSVPAPVAGAVSQPASPAFDLPPIPGAFEAEVTLPGHYHAAEWSVTFATSAAPNVNWFDVDPPAAFDIQMSIDDGASWTSLLIGEVNQVEWSIAQGVLHVSGMDFSQRLHAAKIQEAFLNQTSSQIAELFASQQGLTANVTPTSTPVGRYYGQDHSRLALGQFARSTNQWELLVYLANQEGYEVYVTGTTLYFGPLQENTNPPYQINWSAPASVGSPRGIPLLNVESLHMQRSFVIAKDIEVQVRSWSSREKKGFTVRYRASGRSSSETQTYVMVKPNLTRDQALKIAKQAAEDISRHERTIDVEMPGELTLTPQDTVLVTGTGSSFDNNGVPYYIDEIRRHISFHGGFRQQLKLKNTTPRQESLVQ